MMVQQQTIIQDKINKYISKLERNLKELPKEEAVDVVNEIKSHIYDSISMYESNQEQKLDEVLNKLGKPEDYARILVSDHIGHVVDKGNFADNLRSFLGQMKVPFILTSILLAGLMLSNTIFLYGEILSKSPSALTDMLKLTFFNLPAILVMIIPMALLYAVPSAFYTIVKSSQNKNAIKSPKLWSMVLITGIATSILTFGINEVIVPYTNHQSVLTAIDMIKKSSDNGQDIVFSKQKSIQEMNSIQAKNSIEQRSFTEMNTPELNKMKFDYYLKFSLPLVSLAFALFGAFIGCLMLSEMFNKTYLMFTTGWLLPVIIWFNSYSLLGKDIDNYYVLRAFLPDILIIGFSLLMILGVFLKKEEKSPV